MLLLVINLVKMLTGTAWIKNGYADHNLPFNRAFTAAGSAWPRLAFIT
jgi:hypothetical protein